MIVVENSFSVGLAVLEVAPPVPLPEVYPPWAASLVLHVVTFVLDPVPPEYFYVIFVNVFLPFPHLQLRVLSPVAVEKAVFKLTLISQLFIGEVEFSETMHLPKVPVADIALAI